MFFIIYVVTVVILVATIAFLLQDNSNKTAMGSWLSYLWWGGNPDELSPISGLSRRDVYMVQKSWAPVNADPIANGTEILRRLFKAEPETRHYFKMIKDIPDSEYPQNIQFKAHVVNLMTAINLAVSKLNQPEMVAAMMNKIGESHSKRKISQKHFHVLKDVIVSIFVEVLKLDDITLGAWGKTVDFWYKNIFVTLNAPDATR